MDTAFVVSFLCEVFDGNDHVTDLTLEGPFNSADNLTPKLHRRVRQVFGGTPVTSPRKQQENKNAASPASKDSNRDASSVKNGTSNARSGAVFSTGVAATSSTSVSTSSATAGKLVSIPGIQSDGSGKQSAVTGTMSTGTGTPSSGTGTQSAGTGTRSVVIGTPSAGTGTPSAETGTQSAGTGTRSSVMAMPQRASKFSARMARLRPANFTPRAVPRDPGTEDDQLDIMSPEIPSSPWLEFKLDSSTTVMPPYISRKCKSSAHLLENATSALRQELSKNFSNRSVLKRLSETNVFFESSELMAAAAANFQVGDNTREDEEEGNTCEEGENTREESNKTSRVFFLEASETGRTVLDQSVDSSGDKVHCGDEAVHSNGGSEANTAVNGVQTTKTVERDVVVERAANGQNDLGDVAAASSNVSRDLNVVNGNDETTQKPSTNKSNFTSEAPSDDASSPSGDTTSDANITRNLTSGGSIDVIAYCSRKVALQSLSIELVNYPHRVGYLLQCWPNIFHKIEV
jgi:hypothetical protein